jgi:hypothetical protein
MATKANLVVDQGATYSTTLSVTDENGGVYDLTGYTGAAQLRKHFTSSNSTSFSVTLDSASGTITLGLTASQTANLSSGRYVYDVEITSSSNTVARVVEGVVTVTPNVTR